MSEAATKADALLERAIGGEPVLWRGRPALGTAILGELAGIGVVGVALGALGLLVFAAFVLLAPTPPGNEPRVDPVAIGGIAIFFIACIALGPPLVLDALNVRRTRYAVTASGLVFVEGIVFLRARRVRPPFPRLELKPNAGGTIVLGEVEQASDSNRREVLFTRIRGLGPEAPRAFAALESLRASAPAAP